MQNKASSGVRSWRLYRSPTRLPVSGKVARVALWRVFYLDPVMVSEAGAFLVGGGLEHHFPNRRSSDSFGRAYYGRSLSPPS